MPNEGCLPGAEEASDNRCRDFGKMNSWASTPFFVRGRRELVAGAGRTRNVPPDTGKRTGIDEWPERPAGPSSIERQVSWLADHRLSPPSQGAVARLPVANRRKATR